MSREFETPLTPPAAAPVQPVEQSTAPQVPIAPPQLSSPAGAYFGQAASPAPPQHHQSAHQIINVYGSAPPAATINGFAIGSLVTAILGIFPAAIALGFVGLNRIAKTGERGRWQAITGIAIGSVYALGWLGASVPLLVLFGTQP